MRTHLEQLQAQVAVLGEQAVQDGLVGDRAGDGGVAVLVAGYLRAEVRPPARTSTGAAQLAQCSFQVLALALCRFCF
jgi:hypothetical protein